MAMILLQDEVLTGAVKGGESQLVVKHCYWSQFACEDPPYRLVLLNHTYLPTYLPTHLPTYHLPTYHLPTYLPPTYRPTYHLPAFLLPSFLLIVVLLLVLLFLLLLLAYTSLFCVCACAHVPWCTHDSQRATCSCQFSLYTM